MIKSVPKLAIIVGGISVILVGISFGFSGEKRTSEVLACDITASHPSDPDKLAAGIVWENLEPWRAIPSCEEAVEAYPQEPRFHYLLGRIYQFNGKRQRALDSYMTAIDLGYPMASYNLGLFYKEDGDIENAALYLERAIEMGIGVATAELQALYFQSEGFSNPYLFQSIYDGSFRGRNQSVLVYMSVFIANFNATPDCRHLATSAMNARASQLAQGDIFNQYIGALTQSATNNTTGFSEGMEVSGRAAMSVARAGADGQLFYDLYSCDSVISRQFFDNLKAWLYS